MTINGLGQFDMMSTYNRIAIRPAETILEQPAKEQKAEEVKAEEISMPKIDLNLDGIRQRSNMKLEDISLDFAKRDPFLSSAADMGNRVSDMDKAVSDMKKDESLQQYQYFVGNTNIINDDEDGIVIMK